MGAAMDPIRTLNEEIENLVIGFQEVPALDIEGCRVVYQGVLGAYSQQAMLQFFGSRCENYHVKTFGDAMEAIQKGEADYAVLPIENSSAGIVSENYDLLASYDNYIIGEQKIAVAHALLGLPGTTREQIRAVYSHPQALMQCADYLDLHREWEAISAKNTAVAARKIREDGRMDQAAIAGKITADLYGLQVLEENIQDNKHNTTRFIIITSRQVYCRDAKHVSICFEIPHESGSLYHILSHFYFTGINMVNIQSRPIPERNWEYRFFVDFEGNLNDQMVRKVLRRLEEDTVKLKILGTY